MPFLEGGGNEGDKTTTEQRWDSPFGRWGSGEREMKWGWMKREAVTTSCVVRPSDVSRYRNGVRAHQERSMQQETFREYRHQS